ncbi:hypothetical protein G8A07_27385 [Roseateles sp. DAIF2]|uniref:hypothetical protein n=1 Tax=Roseateles sp. DAIF2 TaxID=2714952 RepID=UPI0018A27586|nr:hypothetical protein [Roseateles sp. DAIF2]QPF76287.1 hypothetical protein G8A07_27385 [Roseateles sp. DAIF2]
MMHSRRIGAFFSGAALYSAAMLLSGHMAELLGPRDFLYLFGSHGSLGRLFGEALTYALPVFLLALGWSYVTVRPYRRGRRPTTAWCLGGMALAWIGWLFYGVVVAAEGPQYSVPLAALLLSSLVPPLWGLLNSFAALAGVVTAGSLAKRVVITA